MRSKRSARARRWASTLELRLDRLRRVYQGLVRVRLPRIFGLVVRNPRDSMFAVALVLATTAILANGLYLQPGRHPAPIFPVRPLPVQSDEKTVVAAQRSRPPDAGSPKHEPAARPDPAPKEPAVPLPRPRAQNAAVAPRSEIAAEGVNPSWQVSAMQRTLNFAGYGPIRVSGVLDDNTRESIARFERDHNLPVTGQNTLRVRHALGAATGRTLD